MTIANEWRVRHLNCQPKHLHRRVTTEARTAQHYNVTPPEGNPSCAVLCLCIPEPKSATRHISQGLVIGIFRLPDRASPTQIHYKQPSRTLRHRSIRSVHHPLLSEQHSHSHKVLPVHCLNCCSFDNAKNHGWVAPAMRSRPRLFAENQ